MIIRINYLQITKGVMLRRSDELKTFPEISIELHMYTLHHGLYLTELMPDKKYITKGSSN